MKAMQRLDVIRRLAFVLLATTAVTGPALAQIAGQVTVNVFPGGFNWGIYVAQERGLFENNGIRVTVQGTAGSIPQMTGLSEGKFDIAMTAVDNIVAYVEGQGEAPIGPQSDFFAFMGSDTGFLSLVTAPDVKAVADLRGRTLSVDALTTGYAFVLFEILRRSGLQDGDYAVAKVGGMVQRWTALRERKQDGTMLSTPYNILAKAEGFTQLAQATKVIGHYQGNVAAARRSWAAANRDKVIAYIRGYVEAIDWLYDRANREEAVRILRQNLPQMSQDLAERSYDELLDPQDGFFRKGRMDMEGLKTVLDLRSRYGKPAKSLDEPMKYYDPAFHAAAMVPRP
jgi:ABC-type nitrate/sulfonate/bicarbonate transport system substrate-binding protein